MPPPDEKDAGGEVGAVVAVGSVAFGPKHVRFGLFGKIFLTWVLTLPFAGGIAASASTVYVDDPTNDRLDRFDVRGLKDPKIAKKIAPLQKVIESYGHQ